MQDLQWITDQWVNYTAGQYGTGCYFSSSLKYGDHSELDNYHQHQCTATCQSIDYDGNSLPTGGADVAYAIAYSNRSQVEQSNVFQYTATTQQSFTWSVTESLSIGVEVSASAGVPGVAGFSEKLSVTLSLSSTQSQTQTKTQSWSVNTTVRVPPQSTVNTQMVIDTQSYDIKFNANVLLSGYVAGWFDNPIDLNNRAGNDKHHLWFVPIQNVFSLLIAHKLIDPTGYQVTNGGVLAKAQGVFTGSQGVQVSVSTTQVPLSATAAASVGTLVADVNTSKGPVILQIGAIAGSK